MSYAMQFKWTERVNSWFDKFFLERQDNKTKHK